MCAKLFGIMHSNHTDEELWGKNVFNSTFPVAFANYLWQQIPPVKIRYITTDKNFNIVIDDIGVDELFNCVGLTADDLYFSFEDVYSPYERFLEGGFGTTKSECRAKKTDLVVKRYSEELLPDAYECLRPLEIKMTVVPDVTTVKMPNDPGSEIVIRPTTTLYAALGLVSQCCRAEHFSSIEAILHDICVTLNRDDGWRNNQVLVANTRQMKEATERICMRYHKKQIPLLLQPIWKTNGIDHELHPDHALDIIAWSNFAYVKLFLTKLPIGNTADGTAKRAVRCLSRFIQYIYQSSSKADRRINLHDIRIPDGYQTDKEFSIAGTGTREFVKGRRKAGGINDTYQTPRFPRKILHAIILEDGQKKLKPEKRFDQSIYIMDRTGLYDSEGF